MDLGHIWNGKNRRGEKNKRWKITSHYHQFAKVALEKAFRCLIMWLSHSLGENVGEYIGRDVHTKKFMDRRLSLHKILLELYKYKKVFLYRKIGQ